MNQNRKITATVVSTARGGATRYLIHDTELRGFRLVVSPTGRRTFMVRYRVGGGRAATIREEKVGDATTMHADDARKTAREWLAAAARGDDPALDRQDRRGGKTMADLAADYMALHLRPKCKPVSIEAVEGMLRRVILPMLGKRKVAEVTRAEIDRLHAGMAATPYAANRLRSTLHSMFAWAEEWGMRASGANPVRCSPYPEAARERFLSAEEIARLGDSLARAERGELRALSPYAVACLRVLLLTGARKSEVRTLRWDWIDWEGGTATLPDSKTGRKVIYLPPPALSILSSLERHAGNPHCFPGAKQGRPLSELAWQWDAVRADAGLDDVRIHDLRHSFASAAVGAGASLFLVSKLLGHSKSSMTERYAHLQADPIKAAAAEAASRISATMMQTSGRPK